MIIIYNNNASSSCLWMSSGTEWYLFPFENGRDVYPDLQDHLNEYEVQYESLPESLRQKIEVDSFNENIKAIHKL